MSTSQAQTLGEVARRLDDVFRQYESIANSLATSFVTKELFGAYKDLVVTSDQIYQNQITALNARVAELEDDKKWLYRLIVGAVVLALIAVVIGTNALTSAPTVAH